MGMSSNVGALKEELLKWNWGENTQGAVGDNAAGNKSSPVLVVGDHSFKTISVQTGTHNIAQKEDGSTWAWGYNGYGGLGDLSINNKSSPVLVVGNHSFMEITGGTNWSGGLKADGSVWTWGYGTNGALGIGNIDNKSSPVPVIGNHSFIRISGGQTSCMALKADGSVWTWGNNLSAQLGDNTSDNKSSPVLVVGAHSFVQISSGGYFCAAIKSNGEIWMWGRDTYGQLGQGTSIAYRSSPVLVVGNHSCVQISSGGYQTLILKDDGSVWAWGRNEFYGELGDGTLINRSSPVLVIGSSIIEIATGSASSHVLNSDGTAWSWGYNSQGNLGDGTITSRSSPVLVVGSHSFITYRRRFRWAAGTTCWGHDTAVTETNIRDFFGNWGGTGVVSGSGDTEKLGLLSNTSMESEVIYTGAVLVTLTKDKYQQS